MSGIYAIGAMHNVCTRHAQHVCQGTTAAGGAAARSGATISADGDTIAVHIPMTFRKRGGRKMVVTPSVTGVWHS